MKRVRCLVRVGGGGGVHEIGEVIEMTNQLADQHIAAGNVAIAGGSAPAPVLEPAPALAATQEDLPAVSDDVVIGSLAVPSTSPIKRGKR